MLTINAIFLYLNIFFLANSINSIQIFTSKHRVPTIVIYINDHHDGTETISHNVRNTSNQRYGRNWHSKQIFVRLHHHVSIRHDDDENYQLRLVNGTNRHRTIHVRRFNLSNSILHFPSSTFQTIESKLATNQSIRMIRFQDTNVTTNQTSQIYTSRDYSTFLLVTIDNGQNVNNGNDSECMIRMYGLIDSQMMIMPLQNQSSTSNFHRITNGEQFGSLFEKSIVTSSNNLLWQSLAILKQPQPIHHIYPEITLLIDYRIHRMAHEKNVQFTWRYGVMFVQMLQSLFFRTIINQNFQIHLHLKQILVAEQPWPFESIRPQLKGSLASNNKTANRPYLNALHALRAFGHWIYNHTADVQSDLILILTGHDLCLDDDHDDHSCSYSSVKGQAIVGGACRHHHHHERRRALNLAIVEDNDLKMVDGLHAMAHEVAHLFGAVHDGEWPLTTIGGPGGTNCRDDDSFVMSMDHGSIVDPTTNQLRTEWSKCTLEQFQHFFSKPHSICLFNEPTINK
ncbi:hypothetical protein DERF_008130 [Dermatophagoides farinae]|uniref:A disintegrin and metalloproteinase with thrombospondin motifs family protein n=1 Tax=Dermatophagoides farinae TaxID=6954 RepID=A0A922I2K5_DERFA|nr:uncharacterized protein LOC124498624 [Dermatophagoides farinae]KAH7646841.1 a disintegrin and metalloproteinase with thrombospondin motifs family protein [Dermatophagoides farinae]KAH9517457.1 hypothetical protein DERF_008130 [Dermatophagoides farinae]